MGHHGALRGQSCTHTHTHFSADVKAIRVLETDMVPEATAASGPIPEGQEEGQGGSGHIADTERTRMVMLHHYMNYVISCITLIFNHPKPS